VGNWHDFFVAELGASAGFAGLLFVSLSVNQTRIFQYGGLPERGLQALTSLFLVFIIATLALAPDQPPRLLGVETLSAALLQTVLQTRLQILGLRLTDKTYRRSLLYLALLAQCGSATFAVGSVMIVARGDWIGLYWFIPGTIVAFATAGFVAWILLIEINR
jgi:multisubunit Na+/H+ antiporter MnhF subunit